MKVFRLMSFLVLTLVLAGASAQAGDVALTPVASGWYGMGMTNANGYMTHNYFVGSTEGSEFRDFFVFDLAGVAGPLQSPGSLSLYLPVGGMATDRASETYNLYAAATSINDLLYGGYSSATFNALTGGDMVGSVTVPAGADDTLIMVNLNDTGIALLQSSLGQQIAFGGALADIAGATTDRYLFAYSSYSDTVKLTVDPILAAEPASGLLLITGLLPLFWRRKRA